MFPNDAKSGLARTVLAGGLAVSVMWLVACNAPDCRIRTATALRAYGRGELAVGDPARNFAFRLADGRVSRLSAQRGRVTVLVFPDDPAWPDCAQTRGLAELAVRTRVWSVGVVVVSVGRPDAPCSAALEAGQACEIPAPHVLLVCDPHGTVRALYGQAAAGRYYLLSNFLKIAAIGDLDDLDELEAAAARLVREIYDQDDREGAYDMYSAD